MFSILLFIWKFYGKGSSSLQLQRSIDFKVKMDFWDDSAKLPHWDPFSNIYDRWLSSQCTNISRKGEFRCLQGNFFHHLASILIVNFSYVEPKYVSLNFTSCFFNVKKQSSLEQHWTTLFLLLYGNLSNTWGTYQVPFFVFSSGLNITSSFNGFAYFLPPCTSLFVRHCGKFSLFFMASFMLLGFYIANFMLLKTNQWHQALWASGTDILEIILETTSVFILGNLLQPIISQ